jgi:DNA helicase II / ATP-dependent DNA helicase PcrA
MRFPEQFPGAVIVKLEENYRSTEPILQLTNAIIANAEQKFTKTLFTSITGGSRPLVAAASNEAAEARYVVQEIRSRHEEGVPLGEIAVLFRSGFHSFKLEIELAGHGFDFDKRGGLKLTESAHIKDLLSFFRIVINPGTTSAGTVFCSSWKKSAPKRCTRSLKPSGTPTPRSQR